MALPDRKVLLGMALGAFCATAIAAIGPGAVLATFADEAPAGIDVAGLVKFNDHDYAVHYEDWVDTTPTARSRVKKIEFGRVSYVDVTTTSTGTYSTDALFSNHIQYPGISVDREAPQLLSAISVLGGGGQWLALPLMRGNSFVHIDGANHSTISGGGINCTITRHSIAC